MTKQDSEEQAIIARIPHVRSLAWSFKRRLLTSPHILLDDLIGAGMVGLMKAVRRTSHPLDSPQFGTFLQIWVRGEMRTLIHRVRTRGEVPLLTDPPDEREEREEPPATLLTQVSTAFDTLPHLPRSILYLHYVDGLTLREVATLTGWEKGDVLRLRNQVVKDLRKELAA